MTIQSGGGAALAIGYFRAGLQPATSTAVSVTDPSETVRETDAGGVAFDSRYLWT